MVNLQLLRNGKKVEQVVYGREYTLRADITHPDGKSTLLAALAVNYGDAMTAKKWFLLSSKIKI